MSIVNKQIETRSTDILNVPDTFTPPKRYAVTAIMICNTANPDPGDETAGTVSVDMHFIPSGNPRSDFNMVLKQLELRAGETFSFDTEKIILDEGDKVTLLATPEITTQPTINASEIKQGKRYKIISLGDTDWAAITGVDTSDPNFTGYSAEDIITAQTDGPTNTTGTVKLYGYTTVTATVSYLEL